jgi:hypothetical protein
MSFSNEIADVEYVAVSADELATFQSEDDFLELVVRLMIEVGSYATIAACTLGESSTWDRDHAAVGGNMVRLLKLIHALLDQICQRRGEIVGLLLRLIFEAQVNIRFLILEFSPELIDSYIANSLKHERKLRDLIQGNIAERGGVMLPIEDRMLQSVSRTAKLAKLSLDEVSLKGERNWGGKNAFEKASRVGLDSIYLAAFGRGSNSVHGNWNEIAGHHLEYDDSSERFTPSTDWARPRPQLPLALGGLIVDTLKIYFEFMGGPAVAEELEPLLGNLSDRILQVTHAHEIYLGRKQWPEI